MKLLMWSFWPQYRIYQGVTLATIAERVADKHGVTVADLKGRGLSPEIVTARFEFMTAARRETDKSLAVIGRFLDRHHTTILSGLKAYQRRLAA